MSEFQEINIQKLPRVFTPEDKWTIIPISSSDVDLRPTEPGSRIRCIDKRFGTTPEKSGYDPDLVPKGPAWMGALDGIAAFYPGSAEVRVRAAIQIALNLGHEPAIHGDYLKGHAGCGFATALAEGQLPDLSKMSLTERLALKKKYDVHLHILGDPVRETDGFILNNIPNTTVMTEGGRFYVNDVWFAQMAGITLRRSLPVIARVGNLLLSEDHRNLFVVQP